MRVIVIPLNSTEPEFRDVEEYSTVGDVVANCANYDLDTEVFENMVIEECEVVEEAPDTIEIEVVVFGNRQRLQVAPGTTVADITASLCLDSDARVTLRSAAGAPTSEVQPGSWAVISKSKTQGG